LLYRHFWSIGLIDLMSVFLTTFIFKKKEKGLIGYLIPMTLYLGTSNI